MFEQVRGMIAFYFNELMQQFLMKFGVHDYLWKENPDEK